MTNTKWTPRPETRTHEDEWVDAAAKFEREHPLAERLARCARVGDGPWTEDPNRVK